jgi:MoxR-like ATPase
MSQVVLADEINRATPAPNPPLLSDAGAAGDDRWVYPRAPRPFLVMATQNPLELEGTFPLPEAQIDRFLLRVVIGYPSDAEESASWNATAQKIPCGTGISNRAA